MTKMKERAALRSNSPKSINDVNHTRNMSGNQAVIGSYYRTHSHTTPSKSITFPNLCQMAENPAITRKNKTALITPTDAPGKKKDIIEGHDSMTVLWADIDSGNKSLSELKQTANDYGITNYLIYSTASATADDKRWRIVIPISHPMCCGEWQFLQEVLAQVFGGDMSATKVTQGFYAPTTGEAANV